MLVRSLQTWQAKFPQHLRKTKGLIPASSMGQHSATVATKVLQVLRQVHKTPVEECTAELALALLALPPIRRSAAEQMGLTGG